jgi:hypothetical protein
MGSELPIYLPECHKWTLTSLDVSRAVCRYDIQTKFKSVHPDIFTRWVIIQTPHSLRPS